jgi:hypothetical protein
MVNELSLATAFGIWPQPQRVISLYIKWEIVEGKS